MTGEPPRGIEGVEDTARLREENTFVPIQVGRTLASSATMLVNDVGATVQVRDLPGDPHAWTALEWVMKARPDHITADEFIVSMAMRPKPVVDNEARRHSAQHEVLAFDVRTLVIWMRAPSLERHVVDVLERPQIFADWASDDPRRLG